MSEEEERADTPAMTAETRHAMEARHKAELRELEARARFLIKQANKNKKKVAEAEAVSKQVGWH